MKSMLSLLLASSLLWPAKLPETIDGGRMVDDVKTLSSEQFKGRWTGTPELERAGNWIAKNFQKAGLKPPFVEGPGKLSYRQKLIVSTESKLGPKNTLRIANSTLTVARDYLPRVFSADGDLTAPMVFAGYGISAPEQHYDDYAEVDVGGKVAVVLRYEPQDQDEKSVFDGKTRTRHSGIETKAINAKMHGAVAMILINNTVLNPEDAEKLDPFGNQTGASNSGIPVLQVRASLANQWFAQTNRDLKEIVNAIDKTMQPRSFLFPATWKASMHVEVDRVMRPTYNIAAYLPGETGEYIVIGAHYDHLGLGRHFSMAPSEAPKMHPGADDNASGTAAILELARYFSRMPKQRRGILFAAFTGEEIGLLGSSHMAGNMPFPIEKCAAMINLDMVGRMKEGKFFISGSSSGSSFRGMLTEILSGDPALKPDFSDNLNVGGSDHTSFLSKKIPTLFFFTGLHGDYHKPSDTWDKFDPRAYAKVITVVAAAAQELAAASVRPEYLRVETPLVASAGSGAAGSGTGGYGPYFGSVPDFAEVAGGVKLADVRAGSPAEKAGVKAGDILTEFDGKAVGNLQDYTFLLRSKKAGDLIEIKVNRLGRILSFQAVLGVRK